jgi:GntR family transcriptional regulator
MTFEQLDGISLHRDTYRDVKLRVRQLVEQLVDRGERRLPAEEQLSALLGVSRPTVRSALLSLQKDGLLQRSHGRGTFINRHAVRLGNNLADDRPFVDIIQELGHEPAVTTWRRGVRPIPADIAGRLDRPADAEVLVLERLFMASGVPAVYAVDHVPRELLPDLDAPGESSVFAFLEHHAGRTVRYSVADIVPVVGDDGVAAHLQVPVGTPVLLLLHTHIDDYDEPVAVTRAFINPAVMPFSVVRTYRDI